MKSLAKIGATLATIVAIAALIAALGGNAAIEPSRADILDFSGAVEDQRAFRQALDSMGHGAPETYVVNGNQIRLSTARHDVPPRRALAHYQQAFVRRGLNDEAYTELSTTESLQRTRTGLTGGLVPSIVSPDQVVMRGAITGAGQTDYRSLLDLDFQAEDGSGMAELFEGFRWVELRKNPGTSGTKAVAIWSGEEFDYDRMFPEKLEERARRADPDLPVCPNCQLVNQFADPDRPDRSEAYLFVSEREPASLEHFYEQHCKTPEQGEASAWWDELTAKVEIPDAKMRRVICQQEDRRTIIKIHPTAEDKTAVRMERDVRQTN